MIQRESLDLSVVLTLHNEGQLAMATIHSIDDGITEAERHGLRVELIICLDAPSAETIAVIESLTIDSSANLKVLNLNNRDLGLSRNDGVRAASGDFVVFCDGDDLYSRNWFLFAHRVATGATNPTNVVVHPDAVLTFGERSVLYYHPESAELASSGTTHQLLYTNLWVSGSLIARVLVQRVLFRPTGIRFGYEDWGWFAELTTLGVHHLVAPRTAHFVRRKPDQDSLLSATIRANLHPYFGDLVNHVARHDPVEKASRSRTHLVKRLAKKVFGRSNLLVSLGKVFIRLGRRTSLSLHDPGSKSPSFLRFNDDVASAQLRGESSPLNRFRRYQSPLRRVTSSVEIGIGGRWPVTESFLPLSGKVPFPKWVAALAAEQSTWEDAIQPLKLSPPEYYNPFAGPGAPISMELLSCMCEVDAIILVPWLVEGGADLAVVELVIDAKRRGFRPIVISTAGECNLRWKKLLDENDIRFGRFPLSGYDTRIQGLAIHHLISASNCRWIHVMNSPAGWSYIKQMVPNLRPERSPVVTVQLFCPDYDDFDTAGGYLPELATTHHKITAVLTDNAYLEGFVESKYGISTVPFFQLHHPIKTMEVDESSNFALSHPPRIVWASRPVRQKNLKLALEVLSQMDTEVLDLFGARAEDLGISDAFLLPPIKRRVRFHGKFTSFEDVHQGRGGVFFYTSLWDGLPNVVLEALGAGMFVVAPQLPGLVSSIDPTLIDYFDHGDSLHSIAGKLRLAISKAESGLNVNGINFISQQFSLPSFRADLDAFFDSTFQG